MPERAPSRSDTIAEGLRERIRAEAARHGLRHVDIARRMTQMGQSEFGQRFTNDSEYDVSKGKVGHTLAGDTQIQVEDLELWAAAVFTSVGYLFGATWDPRPDEVTRELIERIGCLVKSPRHLRIVKSLHPMSGSGSV